MTNYICGESDNDTDIWVSPYPSVIPAQQRCGNVRQQFWLSGGVGGASGTISLSELVPSIPAGQSHFELLRSPPVDYKVILSSPLRLRDMSSF